MRDTITSIFGFIGLACGWFFGNIDGLFTALIVFVVTDYLTGVISSAYRKKLSSKTGFRGILKKILIFTVVGIANIIDTYITKQPMLRTAMIFFYISNEGISILENITATGLKIPHKIVDVLEQLNKEDEHESSKTSSDRK